MEELSHDFQVHALPELRRRLLLLLLPVAPRMKHDWQPIKHMDGMQCSVCKETAQCEEEWPRADDECPGFTLTNNEIKP
jgi:hypothetical protein